MSKCKIKKGTLLLAQPFMLDPNFKRSVVLLTDHHHSEGTVGYVLNKRLKTNIKDLLEDFPEIESSLYVGGPVSTETLHYIHNVGDILDGSIKISDGVYWGGDFDKLKFLIKSQLIQPNNIRFFLGYSGWSAGQLDDELESGSWMQAELYPNYIFKTQSQDLWREVTKNKGGSYSVIAEMPSSDGLN